MEDRLVVDLPAKVVRTGDHAFDGQWFTFYTLLALARCSGTEDLPVSVTTLARVEPWCRKLPDSVGKEIARHIDALAGRAQGSPVEHAGKTRLWRLSVRPESIRFIPSQAAVAEWAADQTIRPVTSEHVAALDVLVHATIKYQDGFPLHAQALLDASPFGPGLEEPALDGWRAILEARVAARTDDDEGLQRILREWLPRTDLVGASVNARLHALQAMRDRFKHSAEALTLLSRLESALETRGDASSTAVVLNVMGLLDRRRGRPDAASWRLLRSAALHGLTDNFDGLSSALFNLALAMRSAQPEVPPGRDIFHLIDLCLRTSHFFHVGYHTAQASITAARWAAKAGSTSRARTYLRGAKTLVRRQLPSEDLAAYHLVLGEIGMLEGAPADEIRRNLDVALRGAADAQDTATMELVTRHLDTLSASSSGSAKNGRRTKDWPEHH